MSPLNFTVSMMMVFKSWKMRNMLLFSGLNLPTYLALLCHHPPLPWKAPTLLFIILPFLLQSIPIDSMMMILLSKTREIQHLTMLTLNQTMTTQTLLKITTILTIMTQTSFLLVTTMMVTTMTPNLQSYHQHKTREPSLALVVKSNSQTN